MCLKGRKPGRTQAVVSSHIFCLQEERVSLLPWHCSVRRGKNNNDFWCLQTSSNGIMLCPKERKQGETQTVISTPKVFFFAREVNKLTVVAP